MPPRPPRWGARRPPPRLLPRRDPARARPKHALGVERQEPRQELVLELGGPIEPGLGGLALVRLLLEEHEALRPIGEVVPAVSAQHRLIHGGVQLAQPLDVDGPLALFVKAVVGLGQALAARDHQGRPVRMIGLARRLEGGVGLEALREREGAKAISQIVAGIILHCRRQKNNAHTWCTRDCIGRRKRRICLEGPRLARSDRSRPCPLVDG